MLLLVYNATSFYITKYEINVLCILSLFGLPLPHVVLNDLVPPHVAQNPVQGGRLLPSAAFQPPAPEPPLLGSVEIITGGKLVLEVEGHVLLVVLGGVLLLGPIVGFIRRCGRSPAGTLPVKLQPPRTCKIQYGSHSSEVKTTNSYNM